MRRIIIAVFSTISGLVLLFSYHTSTNSSPDLEDTAAGDEVDIPGDATSTPSGTTLSPTTNSLSPTTSSPSGSSPSSNASSSTPTSSTTPPKPSSTTSSVTRTYTGAEASTQWGTVQVRITVRDGRIVTSDAIQYPNSNTRDQQINAYAVPQLNTDAVRKQSADLDNVSGATVTSNGYKASLQSAIDKANL